MLPLMARSISFVGRVWLAGQEHRRRHDLPRLAVAALRYLLFDPGALHGMAGVGRQALDRDDPLVDHGRDGRDAGALRLTVHVHGTRTAEGHPASEPGSGHAEHVPQHPQQGHGRRYVDLMPFCR